MHASKHASTLSFSLTSVSVDHLSKPVTYGRFADIIPSSIDKHWLYVEIARPTRTY
jgi:hypothetical protein